MQHTGESREKWSPAKGASTICVETSGACRLITRPVCSSLFVATRESESSCSHELLPGVSSNCHDDGHDAFMTIPAYAFPREEEAQHLRSRPKSCRVGFCVRECPPTCLKIERNLVRQNWPERLGPPPKHLISGVPAYVDGSIWREIVSIANEVKT